MLISHGDGNKAQLVRETVGVGGLKLLSLPLMLAANILLARGLGPEGYGQYVFVMAVISLLALPIGPGLGQLITREVARYDHDAEWSLFCGLLRRAYEWVLVGSALLMLLLGAFAATRAEWEIDDRWTLILVAIPMLALFGLNAVRASTLRGLRHVFYAQLPELFVQPSLHLVIAATLMASGILNPATALASQMLAMTGALLLGVRLLQRNRPHQVRHARPDYRNREWGRALLPFTLLAAVSTLNGQIGILILGWLGTDADVAGLQVAMTGAMVVAMSLTIINLVIGPQIVRVHQANDKARLRKLFRRSARAALAVAIPIAIPLIVLGSPLIKIVYGGKYADIAVWPLAILAGGQLVNVAFGSAGLFLLMSGYERDSLAGQIVGLIVTSTLGLVLIPQFGLNGAAISIAVGIVTWNSLLAMRFVKRFGFSPSVS